MLGGDDRSSAEGCNLGTNTDQEENIRGKTAGRDSLQDWESKHEGISKREGKSRWMDLSISKQRPEIIKKSFWGKKRTDR